MIRFWLCLLIILLCGSFGRLKSKKIKLRIGCMTEMKEILIRLQADMKNEMMTITQALQKESFNSEIFGEMLIRCAAEIKASPGKAFSDIWDQEFMNRIKNDSVIGTLNAEETALISKTGKSLVNASMSTQDTYFKMLYLDYDRLEEKVKHEADKKTKLYNSLSLMAGFFIAILLI